MGRGSSRIDRKIRGNEREGINGEERSVEQALLSYELATRTFQTLCEVNPSNGAFPGLLAMIRARHAQFCMTYPVESPEKGKKEPTNC